MEYLTAAEASDLGVLLEINRRLLHPRGLAAEITYDEETAAGDRAILRIQDHRADPEGVYYGDLDDGDVAKADLFDRLMVEKSTERTHRLGYVVQPLPEKPSATAIDVVVNGQARTIDTDPAPVDITDLLPLALRAAGWTGGTWEVRDADGELLGPMSKLAGVPQPFYFNPPAGVGA